MKEQQKFALYQSLADLGFTYPEAKALRRAEITLRRWCGDVWSCRIQKRSVFGVGVKTRTFWASSSDGFEHPIADREAGALRRVRAIVDACNDRNRLVAEFHRHGTLIEFHHRPHPTLCNLYLLTRAQLNGRDIATCYADGLAVFTS
jgi:hypothetical protein